MKTRMKKRLFKDKRVKRTTGVVLLCFIFASVLLGSSLIIECRDTSSITGVLDKPTSTISSKEKAHLFEAVLSESKADSGAFITRRPNSYKIYYRPNIPSYLIFEIAYLYPHSKTGNKGIPFAGIVPSSSLTINQLKTVVLLN